MNICVFLGPSVPTEQAEQKLDAVYLPPAAQGDVYLAATDGAEAIGLVDGYFQGAPSVWHKEILWAMSQGVHVFGSASMGALRAAELSAFGMHGVGRIFEAFRDGELCDDDEVAVIHGPEELGYAPTTVPLVNIRATLALALAEDRISTSVHDALIEVARALPYWERAYDTLLDESAGQVDAHTLTELSHWVDQHAVDRKRDDALEMLERMGELSRGPARVGYQFQATLAWENLVEETRVRGGAAPRPLGNSRDERILNELRLEPALHRELMSPCDSNGLASVQLITRSDDPAPDGEVGACNAQAREAVQHRLLTRLQASGHFDALARRAADKYGVLTREFGILPEYADVMLTPAEVLAWYFDSCCQSDVPVDLEGYASELGFSGLGALNRSLLHEFLYAVTRGVTRPTNRRSS